MKVAWTRVVLFAVLGVLWAAGFALVHLSRTYDEQGPLVDTRPDRPAAALIQSDIPGILMTKAGEHDGAMYYAIARNPFDPQETSKYLDDASYRYRRITLPILSWALHPQTGGGEGLIRAMFIVNTVGVLLGGIGMGGISMTLGGPSWLGVVFGLLPAAWISLRQTDPDVLAMGLVLLAILFLIRGHLIPALLFATMGVLSKESIAIVVIGVALSRRNRDGVLFAVVPIAVVGALTLYFVRTLPRGFTDTVSSFVPPFTGWAEAMSYWAQGAWPLGAISAIGGFIAGFYVLLKYRFGHLFSYAVLLSLMVAPFYQTNITLQDANATRTYFPLWCSVFLVIFARQAADDERRAERVAPERDPVQPAPTT